MAAKNKKKKKKQFKVPRGMRDVLPEEQKYWDKLFKIAEKRLKFWGFQRIQLPILEETELFSKGTGQGTDVVGKEMFSLTTQGGDNLTLRPEFTPNVVRAYLERGLTKKSQPVKIYYRGPVFRYDRPQAGRYRQFSQVGWEILGNQSSVLDAQTIYLSFKILQEMGLEDFVIQVNSVGCQECRPDYLTLLKDYFKEKKKKLCPDCQSRLKENPLRILDCKRETCSALAQGAPQILDHLCSECHDHFKEVLEFLDELEIPYDLNPYLVRGLDYYTKTAFEIWPSQTEHKGQASLGGGGRYDNLIELLGGKPRPAVGVSLGVERIVNLSQETGVEIPKEPQKDIFLAQIGVLAQRKAILLFEKLIQSGFKVDQKFSCPKLKKQLKIANERNIDIVLILGQKEALEQEIIIRDMKAGSQEVVPQEKLIDKLKEKLNS